LPPPTLTPPTPMEAIQSFNHQLGPSLNQCRRPPVITSALARAATPPAPVGGCHHSGTPSATHFRRFMNRPEVRRVSRDDENEGTSNPIFKEKSDDADLAPQRPCYDVSFVLDFPMKSLRSGCKRNEWFLPQARRRGGSAVFIGDDGDIPHVAFSAGLPGGILLEYSIFRHRECTYPALDSVRHPPSNVFDLSWCLSTRAIAVSVRICCIPCILLQCPW
jgi:hypothetical protein